MKGSSLQILAMLSFLLVFNSCEEEDEFLEDKGYVIGFDPCDVNLEEGRSAGYIIVIPNQNDTVISFNFPDTLYSFPKSYFYGYRSYCFFPDSAQGGYPFDMKYQYATEKEKRFSFCTGDINTACVSNSREKQIILSTLTKLDD